MTPNYKYSKAIDRVVDTDPRYKRDAYIFLSEVVEYASQATESKPGGAPKHISGSSLLDAFREYAVQQFGPLALEVLNDWGLHSTEDVGEIVFNMVEFGLLGAQEQDSRDDFINGYDFRKTFLPPFNSGTSKQKEKKRKIA
ncbi:MAG: Minf_1886 family protein [Lentisphaeria bacterium]